MLLLPAMSGVVPTGRTAWMNSCSNVPLPVLSLSRRACFASGMLNSARTACPVSKRNVKRGT